MIPNENTFYTYFKDLTPKQQKAIPLLAAGESGKSVAVAIKCNPATISEWLNHDSDFNRALHVYSQVSICRAQLQLDSLAVTAIHELRDLLLNARSEQVKLKAIELVMNAIGLSGNCKVKGSGLIGQNSYFASGINGFDLDKLIEALGDSDGSF